MEVYPIPPCPQTPFEVTSIYHTVITPLEGGVERRRRKWRFPRRSLVLNYDVLTQDELQTLWSFYKKMGGAYQAFYFFIPYNVSVTDERVGRGDGVTTTFDLPGKYCSDVTVYVDGTPTSITVSAGTGDGGADQATFSSPPSKGSLITCDFVGWLRLKMRFKDDNLNFQQFVGRLYKLGLTLIEVKGNV